MNTIQITHIHNIKIFSQDVAQIRAQKLNSILTVLNNQSAPSTATVISPSNRHPLSPQRQPPPLQPSPSMVAAQAQQQQQAYAAGRAVAKRPTAG